MPCRPSVSSFCDFLVVLSLFRLDEFARRLWKAFHVRRLIEFQLQLVVSELELRLADVLRLIVGVVIVALKTGLLAQFHRVVAAGRGDRQQDRKHGNVDRNFLVVLKLCRLVERVSRRAADDANLLFFLFGGVRMPDRTYCGLRSEALALAPPDAALLRMRPLLRCFRPCLSWTFFFMPAHNEVRPRA